MKARMYPIPHSIPALVVAALLLTACGSGEISDSRILGTTYDTVGKSPDFTQLVINDVDADELAGSLSVRGENFDNGFEPIISVDGSTLALLSFGANEIVATLPPIDPEDDFLVTVRTGDDLENIDSYAVLQDNEDPAEDPVPDFQRLIMFDSLLEESTDPNKLTIVGQGFKRGNWPTEVKANDIALEVDEASSGDELLVLTLPPAALPIVNEPTGGVVLTVKGGPSPDLYDSLELVSSSDFDEDPSTGEVDCSKRKKIPNSGEHWCTTAGQTLRWKTGPLRTLTIPHYFELLEDYEIDIVSYFQDADALPNRRTNAKKAEILKKYQDLLEELEQCSEFLTRSNEIKWDYLSFFDGKMRIKKGYRWDGESRPGRTLGYHMRAAFIHDTFYDLVRLKYIPCTNFTTDRRKDYQNLGDTAFYFLARESGQGGVGARSAWRILRDFGWSKAKLDIEETKFLFTGRKSAAWRFHTMANAAASAVSLPMIVDADGNKTLEVSCAVDADEIDFDAGNSRPLAAKPREGIHQDDVHVTTWKWLLKGTNLETSQNEIDKLVVRSELVSTFTVGELMQSGLSPGVWETVTLLVDEGRDTDKGYFENEDLVSIRVNFDEPPVITGISEPITEWPPNHKYVTFTVTDFVTAVTDDCSEITLDDLVIRQVTSDEPEDGKGDGHTLDDIVIALDGKSVDLRIERQGMGGGRIYTVTIEAVDDKGNIASEAFKVQVLHDS